MVTSSSLVVAVAVICCWRIDGLFTPQNKQNRKINNINWFNSILAHFSSGLCYIVEMLLVEANVSEIT